MGDPSQQRARSDIRQAQAKYEQAAADLSSASDQRRRSFERARNAGLSMREIASEAGLHYTRVAQILRGD